MSVALPSLASNELYFPDPPATHEQIRKMGNALLNDLIKLKATESVRIGKINTSLLSNENNEDIHLNLGPGESFFVHKDSFATRADGISIWQGDNPLRRIVHGGVNEISGADKPVKLILHGSNITGSLHLNDSLYQIFPIGEGKHVIAKINPDKLPEGAEPVQFQPADVYTVPAEKRSKESVIRVLFVMTNEAKSRIEDPEAFAVSAINDANQSFKNSGVPIKYENAGIYHINYSEAAAPTYGDLLSQVKNPADTGLGSHVSKLRDQRYASLVSLIVNRGSSCGMGYLNANKASAFSVVTYYCATGDTHAFAHETGHNLGLQHNFGNIPSYANGYRQDSKSPGWRTIMSDAQCAIPCPRINYWSDPRKNYNGLPMGTEQYNDAVRRLNERRDYFVGFYPPWNPPWVMVDPLESLADLPLRQFFEIKLKNKISGKEESSTDVVIKNPGRYTWPTEVAKAINVFFPQTTLRAGELQSDGTIKVIENSGYRNKVWLAGDKQDTHEAKIVQKTYAHDDNTDWAEIGAIVSSGTPPIGNLPVNSKAAVVLKNMACGKEFDRIEMKVTNGDMYAWPGHLAREVQTRQTPYLRAGEMQDDGTIKPLLDSGYRNRLWAPVFLKKIFTTQIETKPEEPGQVSSSWNQVSSLESQENLPSRQFFEVKLKNKISGNEESSTVVVIKDPNRYMWPTEVAKAINVFFPQTTLRAGELQSDGTIKVIENSGYRNKVWLAEDKAGTLEVQVTHKTYAHDDNTDWAEIGAIVSNGTPPIGNLPANSKVAVVLKSASCEEEIDRIEMEVINGDMYVWPGHLAREVQTRHTPYLRAGEMQDDGTIKPLLGSGYRNRLWAPVFLKKIFTTQIETKPAGTHFSEYEYKYPDNIDKYTAKTRVLGNDGEIYECKPFPYSGWCRTYSPSTNQYEPGKGSNWQEAWIKVER
ncbi:M12 family metallo-peptidase [Chromobacterium violaceum]